MDFNTKLAERLILEDGEAGDRAAEFRTLAVKKVVDKILAGGSVLKGPLQSGAINLSDVVNAIKHKRCLRTADQDFGATYMEQILGTAIRDVIPVQSINAVRKLFGLDKLPPSELMKHKAAAIQQQQQRKSPV